MTGVSEAAAQTEAERENPAYTLSYTTLDGEEVDGVTILDDGEGNT